MPGGSDRNLQDYGEIRADGRSPRARGELQLLGNSAAVEWLTHRIVYAIDLQKGFDILKWRGKI